MTLYLRLVISWVSFLCISRIYFFHNTVEQETWRARFLQDGGTTPLSPCKVLLANHRVAFHTEILESVIAKFPLESIPLTANCDRNNLEFDVIVRRNRQVESWMKYFNEEMVTTVYNWTQSGQKRIPKHGILHNPRDPIDLEAIKVKFDATIEASCYCNEEMIEMMEHSPDTVCIFHEQCDAMMENPRTFWLSPHHERYLFPSVLPMPTNHAQWPSTLPLDLCVIGSSGRRNFSFLSSFLDSMNPEKTKKLVRINLLGKGDFPGPLDNYRNISTQESIKDFVTFQHAVASRCDILLPLLDTKHNGDYFIKSKKKKLSGTIVQAVAYNKPMVVHEEIFQLYKQEHPRGTAWETHTNDPETFTIALTKLVETLSNVTIADVDAKESKVAR